MNQFHQCLQKLSTVLQAEKIPYALVGGLAIAHYVEPHATLDIDLLIMIDNLTKDIKTRNILEKLPKNF
jgi:hypothetical protein